MYVQMLCVNCTPFVFHCKPSFHKQQAYVRRDVSRLFDKTVRKKGKRVDKKRSLSFHQVFLKMHGMYFGLKKGGKLPYICDH